MTTQNYGKVAVLMGGWSAEREISLRSGKAVLAALQEAGVDAEGVDVNKNIYAQLQQADYQRVFNILHGPGGEDGQIQALLDLLELPYTGSGMTASAIAMDKLKSKQIWQGVQLPTPSWQVLKHQQDCDIAIEKLGLPLIIKPVVEGSSVGMTKVKRAEQMQMAWQTAKQYGQVIAEQWIQGKEYTVSILHDQTLPLIRVETPNAFYDYDAKYVANTTQYYCPCGLSDDLEYQYQQLALQAFDLIGAVGWGRVDFMVDQQDQPFLIEVNTIPGMTTHSLMPMAAKQNGLSFVELVLSILDSSTSTTWSC